MKTVKKIIYSIGSVLLFAVMVFVGTGVIQLGMDALCKSANITISEDMLYSLSGTFGIAVAGIIMAAYARKKQGHGDKVKEKGLDIKKALLYGVFGICVCHIFFSAVTTILFAQIAPMTYEQSRNSNIYMDILCSVILAPIGEELLLRSGLYSLLKRRLKTVSAIILCSFAFAVMHGYNLLGFASCLLAGFLFTLIYEKTGNVLYSIIVHALCNLHSCIFNTMERKGVTLFGTPIQYEVNGYNMYHVIVIVAALMFCAGWLYYNKMQEKIVKAAEN